MKLVAVIGNETHSTSAAWAKVSVGGRRLSHRDAISKEWLTSDRHASWAECIFEVPEGAEVVWEAGANHGYRGSERVRQHFVLTADPDAPEWESPALPYPGGAAKLRGRLRLVKDLIAERGEAHQALMREI